MKSSNFSQEASTFLFQSSIEELQKEASLLSPSHLTVCISLLQNQEHRDTQERMNAIVKAIEEPSRLEAIGKGLSLNQFLKILSSISEHILPLEKLSPLLVGLSPLLFQQVLMNLDSKQLKILQQESSAEPLQHQLTLCMHAYEQFYLKSEQAILKEQKTIEEINVSKLTYSILFQIEKDIQTLKTSLEEVLIAIDQSLAITWTSNRLDLIQHFNQLKDHFHYQLHQQIGSPFSANHASTGLYKILEEKLSAVFGSSVKDNDAAIEGLTQFSIWYLNDYWDIGLLPAIKNSNELELDSAKHNEKERLQHREALLSQVQQNLYKLHLRQVGDLKKSKIFSKDMLKEFISKNHHLFIS